MAAVSGVTDPTRNTAMFLDPVGLGDHLNATSGYRTLKLPLIWGKVKLSLQRYDGVWTDKNISTLS